MYERYNDHSRRIVAMAQDAARGLSHSYVGTEHLLLALLTPCPQYETNRPGCARLILENLTINFERAREAVIEIIGEGDTSTANLPFTPRAKKVLELALRETLQLNGGGPGTWVAPEHILLGLIREGEGVAVQAIVKLGVDGSRVRQAVIDQLRAIAGISEDRPQQAIDTRQPGRFMELPDGRRVKLTESTEVLFNAFASRCHNRDTAFDIVAFLAFLAESSVHLVAGWQG